MCVQVSESSWDNQEQHLLEMFPKCSVTEARSALSIAKGDMEEAVRLIIEGDVQLKCPPSLSVSSREKFTLLKTLTHRNWFKMK